MVIWIAAIVLALVGILICLGVDTDQRTGTAKSRADALGAVIAICIHLLALVLVSQA